MEIHTIPKTVVSNTPTYQLLNCRINARDFKTIYYKQSGFGGLGVSVLPCWPLVTESADSNPAEAVGILGRKNPQHASFGGEVKPSVPGRILRHVKDHKMAWKSSFRLNC